MGGGGGKDAGVVGGGKLGGGNAGGGLCNQTPALASQQASILSLSVMQTGQIQLDGGCLHCLSLSCEPSMICVMAACHSVCIIERSSNRIAQHAHESMLCLDRATAMHDGRSGLHSRSSSSPCTSTIHLQIWGRTSICRRWVKGAWTGAQRGRRGLRGWHSGRGALHGWKARRWRRILRAGRWWG